MSKYMSVVYLHVYNCFRIALDDAAQEGTRDDFDGSDDDLLDSSEEEDEEEDDKLEEKSKRMPEPGVPQPARPKGLAALASGHNPSLQSRLCSTYPAGNSRPSGTRNDKNPHVHTRSKSRPTVASQMQEMEGRPSVDETTSAIDGAERNQEPEHNNGSGGGKRATGSSQNLIQEYMVSVG